MVSDEIPQDDSALLAVPASPPQTVELMPDPVLPSLARPLATIGGHTYAAVWPYVRRPDSPPGPMSRELIFIRDDGRLLLDPVRAQRGEHAPGLPLAPRADSVLTAACSLLPPHCLWSAAGLQRYLEGRRPDPADVFGRLVAVLNHFIDFTGALAEPALIAEFLAAYILTTWFAPAFPVHGLLWLTGDHGAGKSRLLYLLARLAHLGLPFPGLPSHAALLDLAGLGAALAVDDAYFFSASNREAHVASSAAGRQAMLLAGRQRGALLPSSDGAHRTRLVDVSGPRLFAAAIGPHPRLARYCIVVGLLRTADVGRAALDPADPAAWPPGISARDLTDDLWALALSRLLELPPHLALVTAQAARPGPARLGLRTDPLLGAPLQPWHALLAVASWLADLGARSATPADLEASIAPAYPQRNREAYAAHERWRAQGLPSLFYRLLGLARAYHGAGAAFEASDLTVLALRAVFECVSDRINAVWAETVAAHPALRPGGADDLFVMDDSDHAGNAHDADDTPHVDYADDIDEADDFDDTDDTGDTDGADGVMDSHDDENASIADQFDAHADRDDTDDANDTIAECIRRTGLPYPIPAVFSLTAAQVVAAMRSLALDLEWNLPPEKIIPDVVGRLLGLLRLQSHRTAHQRSWSVTPADLLRLSRAYSQPLPSGLESLLTSVAPNPPP